MIKPQDVPEDFVGIAEELFEEGHWSNNTKVNVARFLDAAIEAGLVSPPCWAVKHDNGVLFGIFGTETEAKLNSCGDDVVEHWRGYGR